MIGLQLKLGTSSEGPTATLNSYNDTLGVSVTISAHCVSCYFRGTAVVTTTGVKTNENLLGDVISFLEDPTGTILNALDLELEVSLENLTGHVEIDVSFAVSGSYTIQIYKTETPVGIQVCFHQKPSRPVMLERSSRGS
jgi:hypothetical protein